MTVNACISVKEELVMPLYDVVFNQKYWDDILWQRTIPASHELMVATHIVCGIKQRGDPYEPYRHPEKVTFSNH